MSGLATCARERSTASFSLIVRLCGSARFSGTGKSVHQAAVLRPLFGAASSHAVRVRLPSFQVAAGAGATAAVEAEAGAGGVGSVSR